MYIPYLPRRHRPAIASTDHPLPPLLRHRDFLKLWAGQTISVFGSQFTGVALPIIAAVTLQATPFELGILNAADTAPFLLFGIIVGVWVDRMSRRRLLILGDLGRGIAVGIIAILVLAGSLRMWHLYVIGFLAGVLTVFFDVAYQAYLPSLVGRTQLVDANSKLETTRAASQVAGPSLGGAIVQFLSAGWAMLIDALTFFASVAFLFAIRKPETPPDKVRGSMWLEAREGFGTVFGDARLRAIAGCTATSNLFSAALGPVFVIYVLRVLGVPPVSFGIIFGLGSLGALAGALLAGRIAKRVGVGRAIVGGSLLFGFGMIPVLVTTQSLALPVLIGAQFTVLFGALVYNVNQVSLRQAITPDRLQGRMNATMRFLVWGTLPLGALLGGFLGSVLDIRVAMTIAIAGGGFAFLWVLLSPVWSLARIPEPAA